VRQASALACEGSVSLRVSPQIRKKEKEKYGEKRFSIWRMKLLHPAMRHEHDIEFARWQHPAMWQVAPG